MKREPVPSLFDLPGYAHLRPREVDALTFLEPSTLPKYSGNVWRLTLCDLERLHDGTPETLTFETQHGEERDRWSLPLLWHYCVRGRTPRLLAIVVPMSGALYRCEGDEIRQWMFEHALRTYDALPKKRPARRKASAP